jgi:hypothetical protein
MSQKMATFNFTVSQPGHACNLDCFILGYEPAQSDMWLQAFRKNRATTLPLGHISKAPGTFENRR